MTRKRFWRAFCLLCLKCPYFYDTVAAVLVPPCYYEAGAYEKLYHLSQITILRADVFCGKQGNWVVKRRRQVKYLPPPVRKDFLPYADFTITLFIAESSMFRQLYRMCNRGRWTLRKSARMPNVPGTGRCSS